MRESAVVVIGSANMDVVMQTPRAPALGETLLGGVAALLPGGKGANQAVAAARFGARTRFVGAVGEDDFGRALRAFMGGEGIELSGLRAVAELPTATAVVLVELFLA
jgi:ribokinase